MSAGYYITGTDTGVGKTVASVALLRAFQHAGQRAVGMKPVASGCEGGPAQWRNEDALQLQRAGAVSHDYDTINPYALPAATAPQLAAREAGVQVLLSPIVEAFGKLAITADVVVVEGVGGWLAPLADDVEQAQLARVLELPVILVVGLRLGCLNHARLTARAILADGLPLAGWIGSCPLPADDRDEAYWGLLRDALPATCLGILPHVPDVAAEPLARFLRLPPTGTSGTYSSPSPLLY